MATEHVLEQNDAIERFQSKIASIFPSFFRRTNSKRQVAKFSGIDVLSVEELERQIELI